MDERRKPRHLEDRGPQQRVAGECLIVAVDARGIDSPRSGGGHVPGEASEGEPVDAEREWADRQGSEVGREGDAHQGGDRRAVNLQPRKIASRDCGGSVAGASRIDSVGRRRRAPRRRTTAEAIEIPTNTRTMRADATKSKAIGTWWPKTIKSSPRRKTMAVKNPTAH